MTDIGGLSFDLERASGEMLLSPDPQRRAFGRLLKKCADACWKIYRVEDQGKEESPADTDAIAVALGKNAKALVMAELVAQAEVMLGALNQAITDAKEQP